MRFNNAIMNYDHLDAGRTVGAQGTSSMESKGGEEKETGLM